MSKLTTDYLGFTEQIKGKLLFPITNNVKLIYFEFSALPYFSRFSIQWVPGDYDKLIVTTALNDFDKDRLGVYDLENIKVHQETTMLNKAESKQLENLFSQNLQVFETNNLVLDGCAYSLSFDGNNFNWILTEQLNKNLSDAINYLKQLAQI